VQCAPPGTAVRDLLLYDAMWGMRRSLPPPSIETVRKHARILVIDDQVLPAQTIFERDGYHFERWPEVKNLSQLTDGHYQLILLDIQGVGLNESPDMQGLGILSHIKQSNPAQAVIVYSAQRQRVSSNDYLSLADAVLDKRASYVQYKEQVDKLLLSRADSAYFISAMNRELGENAIHVPAAVPKAIRAIRRRNARPLARYLADHLPDPKQAETIISIINVGIRTAEHFLE
jgi:CheY-like chemotaxis protein